MGTLMRGGDSEQVPDIGVDSNGDDLDRPVEVSGGL